MRLLALELRAFGPFRDVALDFSGAAAIHVVHGPNEAGKSTALRAITGLLYGIPHLSPDAHTHRPEDLRVGGRLASATGAELAIVRRKGRVRTLLDAAGEPLPEHALLPFLGGIGEEVFRAAFGLDHETLRLGAQALLEGRGHLGESLFGAGLGGTGIPSVLAALRKEADDLYSPLARTKKLNLAIRAVADARKRAQSAALPASAWLTQEQAIREGHAERARLDDEAQRLRAEERRLRRARTLLGLLAQVRTARAARAALADVPLLPDDATSERTLAEAEIAAAAAQIRRAEETLARLAEQRDALSIPHALVAQADAIEDVSTRLGSHRKAAVDLPRVRAELRAQEEEILDLVRHLGVALPEGAIAALVTVTPLPATPFAVSSSTASPSAVSSSTASSSIASSSTASSSTASSSTASSLPSMATPPAVDSSRSVLASLRAQVEPLRVDVAREERIRALARDAPALVERARQGEEEWKRTQAAVLAVASRAAALPEPRDVSPLRRAEARAKALGDVAAAIEKAERAAALLLSRAASMRDALGLDSIPLPDVPRLPVPLPETVDAFASEERALRSDRAALTSRAGDARAALARIDAALLAAGADGLPTEADLTAARAARAARAEAARAALSRARAVAAARDLDAAATRDIDAERTEAARDLDAAAAALSGLEAAALAADRVADRLRAEADRVAHRARLVTERTSAEAALASADRDAAALAARTADFDERWRALWSPCAVPPRSPDEMRGWLRKHEALVALVDQAAAARAEHEALAARAAACADELASALGLPLRPREASLDLSGPPEQVRSPVTGPVRSSEQLQSLVTGPVLTPRTAPLPRDWTCSAPRSRTIPGVPRPPSLPVPPPSRPVPLRPSP